MISIKKLLKSFLYFTISILISSIILTIIDYFEIFNTSILKLIIPLIAIFIQSFIIGKKATKLGYLAGLKFGGIIISIFILLVLILDKFNLKSLIYYLILLLTSTLGSMLGNTKTPK